MRPDPRLVRLRDWLDATMGPAPALNALLEQIGEDACARLAKRNVPVNDRSQA